MGILISSIFIDIELLKKSLKDIIVTNFFCYSLYHDDDLDLIKFRCKLLLCNNTNQYITDDIFNYLWGKVSDELRIYEENYLFI